VSKFTIIRGRQNLNANSGYFLIELLVTIVILTGGILFVIDGFRASYNAQKRMLEYEQALAVAKEAFHTLISSSGRSIEDLAGHKTIGKLAYSWQLEFVNPVFSSQLPGDIWIAKLTVLWNTDNRSHIELPFLWER
jgi:type II secretory pathway pseudopilin PulG